MTLVICYSNQSVIHLEVVAMPPRVVLVAAVRGLQLLQLGRMDQIDYERETKKNNGKESKIQTVSNRRVPMSQWA